MKLRLCLLVLGTVVAAAALSTVVRAQDLSKITTVEPAIGKVGDTITLHGEGLGKKRVVAVFLSTTNEDFGAVIVEQAADRIVMRIPKVKAGDYKVSLQVENVILIQPIHLTIEE